MTRVGILGCKDTTRFLFSQVRELTDIHGLVTIDPEMGRKNQVAGYDDLSDLGKTVEIFHSASKYTLKTDEDLAFFESAGFDLLFVAGWQRIVPDNILQTIRFGAFGMHGSSQNLPFGRGRSPMNWSLIEGRQWFFTNLFQYRPGVDDGPILDSVCFSINGSDTAETLHFKNLVSMVTLIRKNWESLSKNNFKLKEQRNCPPTYYPKRTPEDGLIDWGQDVFSLERMIRAVAPPFDGAFSFLNGSRVTIHRASLFYTDIEEHPFKESPAGSVCAVFPNGKCLIRCTGGVLILHEFHIGQETTLKKGDCLQSPIDQIMEFPRNRFGNFDI